MDNKEPSGKPSLMTYVIVVIVVVIVVIVILALLGPSTGTINSDHGNWNNL